VGEARSIDRYFTRNTFHKGTLSLGGRQPSAKNKVMADTPISEAAIIDCAGRVTDPELGRSFADAHMLTGATVESAGDIHVQVELPTPAYPGRERITDAIAAAIKEKFPAAGPVSVDYSWKVCGKDSGGSIGLRCKNVIAVGSGKGGVGKSTVAASLAYGLHTLGARVGLMDADVYGPSIPHMLGASGQPAMVEKQGEDGKTVRRIQPVEIDGLKTMSMGYLVPPEEAVIWRGPMLHGAITQFLKDTDWGELDYLFIDLPPGTGDVTLTLSQLLGLAGAVVVCTPQQVALLDAIKALKMFEKVKIPVLGIVENMSGDIFGRGGAQQASQKHNVPFLGELPIDSRIRIDADAGHLQKLFDDDSTAKPHLLKICERVAIEIAKNAQVSSQMPSLEIL
jgi:ATP-binding protein involved in chromosome partitioning